MSTIKTWQEREVPFGLDPTEANIYGVENMQAEITELREALNVAQKENAAPKQKVSSVASKAVLAAIRAANFQLVRTGDDAFMLVTLKQPVAWVYEDELPSGYPYDLMFPFSKVDGVRLFPIFAPVSPAQPVNELVEALVYVLDTHFCTGNDGDDARARAHKALASAKAAQPLTKQQVEKVIGALENSVDSVEHEYKQAVELYGGIPRRAAKIDGLLLLWRNHTEAIEIMKGVRG